MSASTKAERYARRQVADICEQAKWSLHAHAGIGLAEAHDTLRAVRSDLAALMCMVPDEGEMHAGLRRIFRSVHLAAEAAEKRIQWAHPDWELFP